MKVLVIIFIIFNLLVSCGKKGDPEFKSEFIKQNYTKKI